MKTSTASHLRRRMIARMLSSPKPLPLSLTMPVASARASLGDEDDVALLQVEVLVVVLAGDHLVVVEGDALHAAAVRTEHDDAVPRRVLVETAREGQDVEHRRPAL